MIAPDSEEARRIDAALSEWRQGDLALAEHWFVHVVDAANPLVLPSPDVSEAGPQAQMTTTSGLIIVTQTCDVVRECSKRPYVEVAPLVTVNAVDYQEVRRGRRPSYATLSALQSDLLVADLDRVMTVEKSIVAHWQRTPGCQSDRETREFAEALARKRARFAFPDDFTLFAEKLQKKLKDKHGKASNEGVALRSLRQIRVQAAPDWQSADINLFFWFIKGDEHTTDAAGEAEQQLKTWLSLVPASGRFRSVQGQVAMLADMTAADYVDSDPLDLDHLSSTTGAA